MPDFRPQHTSRSCSRNAQWLFPLALLIGLLLLLFGTRDDYPVQPEVLAQPSSGTELVSLGVPEFTRNGAVIFAERNGPAAAG